MTHFDFSPSQCVTAREGCPAAKFEEGDATRFGSAVHAALQQHTLLRAGVATYTTPALDLLRTTWPPSLPPLGHVGLDTATRCVEWWWERDDMPPDALLDAEGTQPYPGFERSYYDTVLVPLGREVEGQQLRLRLKMDRVWLSPSGDVVVDDYKTDSAWPDQEDTDSDIQMGLYEIAARAIWGQDVLVRKVFVRHEIVHETRRSEAQREALLSWVEWIVRTKLMQPNWKQQRQLHKWCGYKSCAETCPVFQGAVSRADQIPADSDGLEDLFRDWQEVETAKKALESRAKILKGRVKDALGERGEIVVSGQLWRTVRRVAGGAVRYPVREVREVAARHGLELPELPAHLDSQAYQAWLKTTKAGLDKAAGAQLERDLKDVRRESYWPDIVSEIVGAPE